MPVRKILKWPNKSLKIKSVDINKEDDTESIIKDLHDTMKSNFGLGIAAPQVNIHKNVIVIKEDELASVEKDGNHDFIVLINPTYSVVDNSKINSMESCLSISGYMDSVKRYKAIELQYLDSNFNKKSVLLSGRDSCIVQHEVDHLEGKLFIDRLSQIKRSMFVKKYNKALRKLKSIGVDKEKISKQKSIKTRSINRKKRKSKK